MATEEDVVALVVQCHHLAALQLRLDWKQSPKEMCSKQSKRSTEVVENEFWIVTSWVAMTGQLLGVNPVADGEVECRSVWQMHHIEATGFLLVFIEDKDGSILSVCREFGDFANRVFVSVFVRRSTDVGAVGEQFGENLGLGV